MRRAACFMLTTILLAGCASPLTPTGSSADPNALSGGVWRLNEASMKGLVAKVPAGATVTIEFADGKASGIAACSTYSASYQANTAGSIAFHDFHTTPMRCPNATMTLESAYLAALHFASTISMGETLTIQGLMHTLTFRKQDP